MIPSYLPIRQGFLKNGNLIIEFQPVYAMPEQVDFVSAFGLTREQLRLADEVGLSKEKLMVNGGRVQITSQNEDDGDDE